MLIEVFRAGSPAAQAAGITAADLADVAAFDCANNPVPNVIGHPRTDSPAHGAIRGFKVEGEGLNAKLFADVPHDIAAFRPIVEGIKGGSILTRSMAFFGKRHPANPTPGKIAPKHLGFLGGAAPGIAGMKPLAQSFAFSADDDLEVTADPADAVVFDAAPEEPTGVVTLADAPAADPVTPPGDAPAPSEGNTMTAEELKAAQEKLAKDQAAQDEREKTFAADQKSAREKANAATVDGLVAATKVLPADRDALVAAFNAVDEGGVLAFAADKDKAASPVSIIAGIIAKGGKAVPTGDGLAPTGENLDFSADGKGGELEKVRSEKLNRYGK